MRKAIKEKLWPRTRFAYGMTRTPRKDVDGKVKRRGAPPGCTALRRFQIPEQ
jgi:hypothetical protein